MINLIDEIYENHKKRLEYVNHSLKRIPIEEENLNQFKIGVNVDLELFLQPNNLIYGVKHPQDKIENAYDEIFKEGIFMGFVFGKLLGINHCSKNMKNFQEYEKEDAELLTDYDFEIEFTSRIIPPINVKKTLGRENPISVNYKNKKFDEERAIKSVNIKVEMGNYNEYSIYYDIFQMKEEIEEKGLDKYLNDVELSKMIINLFTIRRINLFEKLCDHLEINIKKANEICNNSYYKFNLETAEDMFVSELYSTIEGEYSCRELVERYISYVFNEGMNVGMVYGKKKFIEDIQDNQFSYEGLNIMNYEEKFEYICKIE